MADPFSTVAAVVSFVDVAVRACKGIYRIVDEWKDAPNAINRARQSAQNLESMLGSLRLYVNEYESSKLFLEQQQLLPDVVRNQLRDIDSDLKVLSKCLSPPSTGGKRVQRMKWVLDEKKVSEIVRRLDSRQMSVSTVLQILGQRTEVKLYEEILNVRNDLQQLDASTASHAEGARSSLSQQVDNIARIQSSNSVEHTTALGLIGTRLKPVADSNALVMDKLDQMLRLLATKQVDERASKSHSTFQTASIELVTRIVQAELRRFVPPVVEEYLDPYKSNENAQLEGIRKGLDQIVSDLGHLSAKEAACNHERDQKPGSGSNSAEFRNDAFVPRHDSLLEGTGKMSDVLTTREQRNDSDGPKWTLMWRRNWRFCWPVGALTVYISASRCRSPAEFRAFADYNGSTRYSYSVSIHFQPALSTILARGISIKYKSQQDHRGFYERCPMLTTFAIVPRDAKVFRCVINGDIEALKALFAAGLAAPPDRRDNMGSLLHFASGQGNTAMCEFLLMEGADPLATDQFGFSCMVVAAFRSMSAIREAIPEVTKYYSVFRLLNRYGSDIDSLASSLFNEFAGLSVVSSENIWGDVYLEEKLELEKEISFEERLDLEKPFEIEHKMNTEAKSNPDRELCSEAGYELKADFVFGKELDESVSRENKTTRENGFLNWAQFLCDLGLDVNDMSIFQYEDEMLTPLMYNVLSSVFSRIPGNVMAVFLLCIFGVDVSIRDPDGGYQALHMVFLAKDSVEVSPRVKAVIYILIHYGGADPWATTIEGDSSTDFAYLNGWMEEWVTACEWCGISTESLLSKEIQRQLEFQDLDGGKSTAIDTNDLTPNFLEAVKTIKRRRPVAGDRLME